MRSFKKYIAEVAQPREKGAHEEQAFKDQHVYEVIPHPVALDTQFNGEINAPSAARPADQKGDAAYDQAYSKGMFEESAEKAVSEALSPKQKEIDHDNDGDIDGKDLAALRAKKKNKSVKQEDADLEEKVTHSPKHIKMAIGIASDKRYKGGNMTGAVKAMNKMKPGISDHPQVAAVLKKQNEDDNMNAPDGKTRTVMKTTKAKNTDDSGQDKIITNESILARLEENVKFKVGMLRLKNGKSVTIKKQDSDLLNQMFKDLSATNRRKLGAVAMKDEAGFKEILGFAREAL